MPLTLALQILQLLTGLFNVAKGVKMIEGWIDGKDENLVDHHLAALQSACPNSHRVLSSILEVKANPAPLMSGPSQWVGAP